MHDRTSPPSSALARVPAPASPRTPQALHSRVAPGILGAGLVLAALAGDGAAQVPPQASPHTSATPPAAAPVADAVVLEGHRFPRQAQVAGGELRLNGTGVRQVAWFKGFTAGLYLAAPAGTAAQALATPGPKRLQMQLLVDVPAAEFVRAFTKGVNRNATAEEQARLAPRMARFEALIAALGTVKKHDLVQMDFEPERGMVFRVNGKVRGEPIAGEDFYVALLRSFIGERPYDQRMRAGLLGKPA